MKQDNFCKMKLAKICSEKNIIRFNNLCIAIQQRFRWKLSPKKWHGLIETQTTLCLSVLTQLRLETAASTWETPSLIVQYIIVHKRNTAKTGNLSLFSRFQFGNANKHD